MKKALVVLSFVLGTSATHAATVTVCASGCNYTSVSSAYSARACGDTIQVNITGALTEASQILLNKACTAGSPITIVAGNGYSPVLSPTDTEWLDGAVRITGAYHVWDGIKVYNVPHGNGLVLVGDHNTIQNTVVDRISYTDWPAGQNAGGIRVVGSSNVVQNNTVGDSDHGAIEIDGTVTTPQYNQILNNTIKTAYGHGVWVGGIGAKYNLIDGNDISDCGSLCVGSGCGSKNGIEISGGQNNSVRRNVVHDIYNRAMELSSYSGLTLTTTGNWIYSNTFYNITTRSTDGTTPFFIVMSQGCAGCVTANNHIYNNIADKVGQRVNTDYFNLHVGVAHYYTTEPDAGNNLTELTANDWNGNVLVNNIIRLYYSGAYHLSDATAIYYTNAGSSYHTGWTPEGVNGIGSMAGNITSDPLFTSTDTSTAHWWYPQAGSPAINGGVVVTDPNAAAGGWPQLTYSGSAPDIGAFQSGTELPPPTNLRLLQ